MMGFPQLNTPLSIVVLFSTATLTATLTPTHTPTFIATSMPSRADVLATRLYMPTRTPTQTQTPTRTATASPTSSPSLTPFPTFTPMAGDRPKASALLAQSIRTVRVPILMYHHVGMLPPNADAVRISLTISPELFEAQMKFIADQGFTPIRILDLVNHLQNGAPLPPKPIILTFDDGYEDNYINVFPTLKDYGFPGTFFIISGRPDSNAEDYLTWEQIHEMADNGMEIGNHSLTHRYNLGATFPATQRAEIIESHKRFVQELSNWSPIFSYPSGSYNAYTLTLLRELGYVAAVTTRQGTLQATDALLELRRIRIRGEWNMPQFVYWFNYWTNRP